MLVQNRVAIAEPRLPEEVRRLGVTVRKNSPDLLMVVHLSSPDGSRDQLYISNYATLQVKTCWRGSTASATSRCSARATTRCAIWLDPDSVAGARPDRRRRGRRRSRAQNVQVAAGGLDQPPVPRQGAFQLNVET